MVYAMLFSVSFLLFFFAWAVSSQDTLRAVTYNEERLRSAALAEMGTELAFHLLRSQGQTWIGEGDFSFSNEPGAADFFRGVSDADFRSRFADSAIGGCFRVTFTSTGDTDAEGVAVPEGGTYLLIQSTGWVGGSNTSASSSSQMMIKLGSPFVNNVMTLAAGAFITPNREMHGPLFISDSDDGPGDLRAHAHMVLADTGTPGRWNCVAVTTPVSGQLRSRGRISVVNVKNVDGGSYLDDVTLPAGLHPAGSTFPIPPPVLANTTYLSEGIGGVEFSGETLVEPYVALGLAPSRPAEIFAKVASVSNLQRVDITEHPDGVLVEVDGDQVRLFTAARYPIGRVFDLSMVTTQWMQSQPLHRHAVAVYGRDFGGVAAGLRAAIAEAAWNDPAFPEAAIPNALRNQAYNDLRALDPGASLAEIPATGDYFDLYGIAPGTALGSWSLSRSGWTPISLEATRLSASTEDGTPMAPSVFIRGRVKGKLALSYKVPESIAEGRDHKELRHTADIVVLSEDSPSGVPGGLQMEDRRILTDPLSRERVSQDYILLLTRGRVTGHGPSKSFLGWVSSASNPETRIDMLTQAQTSTTPQLFRNSYMQNNIPVALDGVGIGAVVGGYPTSRYTANYRVIESQGGYETRSPAEFFRRATEGLEPPPWGTITASPPVNPAVPARLLAIFRDAYHASEAFWLNSGALAGFNESEGGATPSGKFDYDYRWRRLNAETLQHNIGIPVQPLLIYRRSR